jgi:hypothetical protein
MGTRYFLEGLLGSIIWILFFSAILWAIIIFTWKAGGA